MGMKRHLSIVQIDGISLRLPHDTREQIDRLASAYSESRSFVIRELLAEPLGRAIAVLDQCASSGIALESFTRSAYARSDASTATTSNTLAHPVNCATLADGEVAVS